MTSGRVKRHIDPNGGGRTWECHSAQISDTYHKIVRS